MTLSVLAPARYLSGAHSLAGVGAAVALLTAAAPQQPRVFVVHGDVGMGLVGVALEASLQRAGVVAERFKVNGPCSEASVTAIQRATVGASVLIGVGGGRVMDATKAAADASGAATVLVPTSPATCAAATAVVVDYTVDGAYLGSRVVRRAPAYTVVEPTVLAAAPDRHLAAGLVDALAKVVEVRFGLARQSGAGAAGVAALALCDELEQLVFADGPLALRNSDQDCGKRQLVAEANVLWPGLIGALAGEGAKLAAAHAVHNALTLLPGVKRSMHGEVLAFGILTQLLLEGRGADELARHADLFSRLGCPMTLTALGAGAYWSEAGAKERVLQRACALPSMAQCFPGSGPEALAAVFAEADALAADFSR